MQFTILTLISICCCVTHVTAAQAFTQALTPTDAVNAINSIVDASGKALPVIKDLKKENSPDIRDQLTQAALEIAQTSYKASSLFQSAGTSPFPKDDQNKICNAFRAFARVETQLLSVIIGKADLLTLSPPYYALRTLISALEKNIDTLVKSLVGLDPTCAKAVKQLFFDLHHTLNQAKQAYQ